MKCKLKSLGPVSVVLIYMNIWKDLSFISTDQPDPLLGQTAPVTLGHEFSGVVENVGKDVSRFKKGIVW